MMQRDCDGAMSTIEWETFHPDLILQGGSVRKSGNPDDEEKDALATSIDALEGPDSRRRGIGFTLLGAGANFAVGLFVESHAGPDIAEKQSSSAALCRTMDFSVTFWAPDKGLCGEDARSSCGVCEVGSCMMPLDEPAAGDQVEIVINVQGCVEYRVNGETRYESSRCPKYPMKLGISAQSCGLLACDLRWIYGEAPAEWVVLQPSIVSAVHQPEAESRGNISPSTTSSRYIPGDEDAKSASSVVSDSIEAALASAPAVGPKSATSAVASVTSQEQEDMLLQCMGCIIEVLCSGLGAIVGCICQFQLSEKQTELLQSQQYTTSPRAASASSSEPIVV
mmetsp:Transcript_23394/g.41158  ORF Transcript_23394/g.41158 Transcript_23394/m.41158 type:complete len:337 (-) Transcript_23394:35-1045(-)